MERQSGSAKFPLGSSLVEFDLPCAQGGRVKSDELLGAIALVVFSCNHCPYVKGSEDQLNKVIREFEPRGLRSVAINANDPVNYPDDSFERMKDKVREYNVAYRYLFDESQQTARAFDAQCTPEAYLFNREGKLIYHGALNDSPRDPMNVQSVYLRTALEQAFGRGECQPQYVRPMGCSIKWKV